MPRVHFTSDFDWKPKPQVTIAYPAGFKGLVTTACADAAEAKGVAKKTDAPEKAHGNLRKNRRATKAAKEAERDADSGKGSDQAGA